MVARFVTIADSIAGRNTLTQLRLARMSVDDETENSNLLHGESEGVDVETLETRLLSSDDRPDVRPK